MKLTSGRIVRQAVTIWGFAGLFTITGLADDIKKAPVSPLVSVEVRMVMMSRETAYDLFKPEVTLGRIGVVKEEILRQLHELVVKKKATVLCQPEIITIPGNTAQVKSVREERYAAEYLPADLSAETNAPSKTAVIPGGFQTREVGTLLNVTPQVTPDGVSLNITLVPELSERLPNIKMDASLPNGSLVVEQPRFRSRQVTTTVTMRSGTTLLLGVADSIGAEEDKDQITLIFLTSTILPVE